MPLFNIENRLEERLEEFLEPRIKRWMHEFMTSARGEEVMADMLAEIVVGWMKPNTQENNNYLEKMVLQLIERLRDQPAFHQKALLILNGEQAAPSLDPR